MNTKGAMVVDNILSYYGLNAKKFSEMIGLDRPQNIYDIQSGKTKKISPNIADKIISVFPALNKTWLLTGEGGMFNGETGCEQENTNPTNMNYDKFFQTIERRDRQFEELLSQTSRLIAVIERMQGIHPTGDQITPPIRVNNE